MSQPNKCLLLCRHAFPLILFCLSLVRPGSRAMGGLATQGEGKEDQSCLSQNVRMGFLYWNTELSPGQDH